MMAQATMPERTGAATGAVPAPILELADIRHSYDGVTALRGVSLTVARGEFQRALERTPLAPRLDHARDAAGMAFLAEQEIGIAEETLGQAMERSLANAAHQGDAFLVEGLHLVALAQRLL